MARRPVFLLHLGALLVLFAVYQIASTGIAWSQQARTIKLIVPVPPGASTDAMARVLAEYIGQAQRITVVIENRRGASGMIGTEAVATAAPDGNTLLVTANTYLLDAQTRHANYHPINSFEPICLLAESPSVMVVNIASPYQTLADLLAAARRKPGVLTMGSVGPGSTFQFGFIKLTQSAGVDMTFVPYPGSAPAVTDLLGGHITSAMTGIAVVSEQIAAGKLRAVAAAAPKRLADLPDVATFTEAGFNDIEVDNWFGVVAPAKTPKDVLAELGAWFTAALQAPGVREKLVPQGLFPIGTCGDQFAALVRNRYDEYGRLIRTANIKVQ